jgi:hypothetical protein
MVTEQGRARLGRAICKSVVKLLGRRTLFGPTVNSDMGARGNNAQAGFAEDLLFTSIPYARVRKRVNHGNIFGMLANPIGKRGNIVGVHVNLISVHGNFSAHALHKRDMLRTKVGKLGNIIDKPGNQIGMHGRFSRRALKKRGVHGNLIDKHANLIETQRLFRTHARILRRTILAMFESADLHVGTSHSRFSLPKGISMHRFAHYLFALPLLAVSACAAPDDASVRKSMLNIAHLQVASLHVARVAQDASGGNVDAFKTLADERKRIAKLVKVVESADPNVAQAGTKELSKPWTQLDADIGALLETQTQLLSMAEATSDINMKMPMLNSRLDEALKILKEKGESIDQVFHIGRLMLLADRMQRRLQSVLQGGEESSPAATGLQRDFAYYSAVLKALLDGNDELGIKKVRNPNAHEILGEVNNMVQQDLAPQITKLLDAAPAVQTAKEAADKATIDGDTLMLHADSLMSRLAR